MANKVFTTGEVAKYTGVNFRTVIRWIDRGELAGYKLPGRGDHRVTLENLLSFLKDNEIPVPSELQATGNKVLIVDDDEAMAKAIKRVLKRNGWQVETTNNGFEAGMKLSEFQPNLLILDLKMPHVDGFKVLALTRKKYSSKELKIIIISAEPECQLQLALEQGADDTLSKPFDNDQLLSVISSIFNQ